MPTPNLSVEPVQSRKDFKAFVKLPYSLYRDDPHWEPPLYRECYQNLHPKKNPFYRHAQVQLFLAKRAGRPVGRISAQINHEYERFHGERVGHFGFFESINDSEVAGALLKTAEDYFRAQGIRRILGPFSFSINEEAGLLVEGFDQPRMVMTPYHPPYYEKFLIENDYQKAKDLYAWHYDMGEIPAGPKKTASHLAKEPNLVVRPLNLKHIREELDKVMEVFNSAWSQNWGFVPLTQAEVDQAAKDLKLFLDPEIACLAEVEGQPAAICVAIPNLYDLIRGLRGRLFPFGIFRLFWRIKRAKATSARLMLLGIKEEFRKTKWGALSMLLYVEMHRRGLKQGYQSGELSWTLEDNHTINMGIEAMGGKRYKTYRVFEKALK